MSASASVLTRCRLSLNQGTAALTHPVSSAGILPINRPEFGSWWCGLCTNLLSAEKYLKTRMLKCQVSLSVHRSEAVSDLMFPGRWSALLFINTSFILQIMFSNANSHILIHLQEESDLINGDSWRVLMEHLSSILWRHWCPRLPGDSYNEVVRSPNTNKCFFLWNLVLFWINMEVFCMRLSRMSLRVYEQIGKPSI